MVIISKLHMIIAHLQQNFSVDKSGACNTDQQSSNYQAR